MGRKKKKFGECPYCWKITNLTEDHIIPRCLFKPNTLERAFKVYVCSECNNDEKSKDDSFLRDLLVVDKDSQGSSTARFIRSEKYESSVNQNQSELSKNYLSNSTKIPMLTKNGVYVFGQRFTVESERLIRIFKRIIIGLANNFKIKIDENAEVIIFKKANSQKEFDEDFEIVKKLHKNGFHVGNLGHTFNFRVQFIIVKEIIYSYWWLVFYENVCFFLAVKSPFKIIEL